MFLRRRLPATITGALMFMLPLAAAVLAPAQAQILLYSQRLPEGTVYMRFASALPAPATVGTDFAGQITLGDTGANRISPYFVAGNAGGKSVALQVASGGATATATIQPKSGTFITVVLHPKAGGVVGSIVTDKPEYNQLKARLTFYNATEDCSSASLTDGTRPIFSGMAADSVQARSVSPVAATVTAVCGTEKAKPLELGKLDEGGLYSVWLMRLGGQLAPFLARDTIAPPRS